MTDAEKEAMAEDIRNAVNNLNVLLQSAADQGFEARVFNTDVRTSTITSACYDVLKAHLSEQL